MRPLALLILLLALAACGSQQPTPAPGPGLDNLPSPPSLPEPSQASLLPGLEASPTTEPVILAETPTPTPAPTSTPAPVISERLPGAYVNALSAALYDRPGGNIIASAPAGSRLGVLERAAGDAWFRVNYQPDPESPAQEGWVRASAVTIFVDLASIPSAEAGAVAAAAAGEPGESPVATVTANRLNLRAGPGVDQRILGVLTRGEAVALVGRSGDGAWLQLVTAEGEAGWAAARWLQSAGDLTSLPVTAAASTGVPVAGAPAAGKIVFQTANGGDIYLMSADGTGLRRLTYGFEPSLSPDGRRVAFTRWDEPRGLWLINSDGSGARLLTGANRARSPSWLPDGSAIIFERSTGEIQCRETPFGCISETQIDEVLGGEECLETPFGTFCRSDFPLSSRSLQGLTRYRLSDGNVRDLPAPTDARAPIHAPAGDRVLFLDDSGLALTADSGNEQPRRLVELPALLGPAVFSPDGRFIYGSRRSGDHWDIWRWRADGSGELALTAPPALRDRPINAVAPSPSPDGRRILFLSDRRGPWELWIMDADGGNQRLLAPAALSVIEFRYDYADERMVDWGR